MLSYTSLYLNTLSNLYAWCSIICYQNNKTYQEFQLGKPPHCTIDIKTRSIYNIYRGELRIRKMKITAWIRWNWQKFRNNYCKYILCIFYNYNHGMNIKTLYTLNYIHRINTIHAMNDSCIEWFRYLTSTIRGKGVVPRWQLRVMQSIITKNQIKSTKFYFNPNIVPFKSRQDVVG